MQINCRVHSADPVKLTEAVKIDGELESIDRKALDVELVHDEHGRHGTIRIRLTGSEITKYGALFERDGQVQVTFSDKDAEAPQAEEPVAA